MKFIKDIINLLFKRREVNTEIKLTKEQKKKYRKQFLNTIIPHALIQLTLIWGIGTTITQFIKTWQLNNLSITIVLLYTLERTLKEEKRELELIQQRINKRNKKNKRTKQK